MLQEWFNTLVLAFTGLFVIVDPFGTLPVFLALTRDEDDAGTLLTARRACFYGAVILAFFALLGAPLLRFLQIDMNAFRAGGGLLLLLTALDMLRSRNTARNLEALDASERADISMVPMAMPLLAGPGAITSVMVLASSPAPQHWAHLGIILIAIALVFSLAYLVLRSSARIKVLLGRTGITAIQRIMGLLLAALSLQFIVQGVVAMVRGI